MLELAQSVQTDASDPRRESKSLDLFGTGFGGADYSQAPSSDVYQTAGAGGAEVQAKSPVQTQSLSEITVDRDRKDLSGILSKITGDGAGDTDEPEFDISDILDESRRMTQANMLMQLGAGIAGGDLSKGISAAGAAGMKGAQEQRALDIRKRLAEYQAGREDIRRGEETRRYEEGMKLKREQFDSDVAYRAAKLSADIEAASGLNRRALLTNVSAMIKETNDEILRLQSLGSGPEDPAMMELQSYLNALKAQSGKYANEIAASLAKADEFDGFKVVGTR